MHYQLSPIKSVQKLIVIFLLIIGGTLYGKNTSPKNKLMPMPQKIESKEGKLEINSNFNVVIEGEGSNRLYKYATRILNRLKNRTGIFIEQSFVTSDKSFDQPDLLINCERKDTLSIGMKENYSLNISDKQAKLTAETDIGAMRGMETLLQLLSNDKEGYYFPNIKIEDSPRFPWRGLLIDVSRHFQPVDVIKRNLDAMAAVKLNVLHWHLSDDQGFRVESKTYPKLHKKASDGKYYTQSQIKEIIDYANERGIRVVPEFDLPGHATSWIVAYPKLANNPNPRKELHRTWGIKHSVVNPTKEYTYTFLDNFFEEMAGLFNDKYIHIGGDEVEKEAWEKNPALKNYMAKNDIKDYHSLQNYFNTRLLKILQKYDKRMIGWQEILHKDMPKDIVLQVWKDKKTQVEAIQSGYQTILSNGYYIDLMKHASKHYKVDPLPDTTLTEKQENNILGGEATMWGEFVTEENIDSRIWPRTAAIAERLWSEKNVNDIDYMYDRLQYLSYRLEEHGLNHITYYRRMLRRLTNNQDIKPLKTLVDVLEPLKIYKRNSAKEGGFYQYSPYTRVMDAARADQPTVRRFNNLVVEFLEDNNHSKNYDEIKKYLLKWKNNHKKLKPIIENSPIIHEIEPASKRLADISEIGLTALENLHNNGNSGIFNWLSSNDSNNIPNNYQKKIKKGRQPVAQTKLRIVDSIEKLIQAQKKK